MLNTSRFLLIALAAASVYAGGCRKKKKANGNPPVEEPNKRDPEPPTPPQPPRKLELWERNFRLREALKNSWMTFLGHDELTKVHATDAEIADSYQEINNIIDSDMPNILAEIEQLVVDIDAEIAVKKEKLAEATAECTEAGKCFVETNVRVSDAAVILEKARFILQNIHAGSTDVRSHIEEIRAAKKLFEEAQKLFDAAVSEQSQAKSEAIRKFQEVKNLEFQIKELNVQHEYLRETMAYYTKILQELNIFVTSKRL